MSEASALQGCVVYVLSCRDGSLYVGWTNDLEKRLTAHRDGSGSRYVRSRLPFTLEASWPVPDKSAALKEELRFRKLTRAQKLALLAGCPKPGGPT